MDQILNRNIDPLDKTLTSSATVTFNKNKKYILLYLNTHIDLTFHILFAEQGQNQLYRHQI